MRLPSNITRLYVSLVRGNHKLPANISELPETTCLNCGTAYHGHFCPNCGQSAKTGRFNLRQTLKHLLFAFTKFDDTFWHTAFELFTRPGHMIRDYLGGHRVEYLKPLQLLVCLVTAYLIVAHLFFGDRAGEQYNILNDVDVVQRIKQDNTANLAIKLAEQALNNMLVSTLMSITLLAFCTYWSFRRIKEGKAYNFAEHFYMMLYLRCIYMFISFVLLPYQYVTGGVPSGNVNFWISLVIMVIVYAQLMRISWRKSMMVCLMAYCMTALIFVFFCGLVTGCYYAVFGPPTGY